MYQGVKAQLVEAKLDAGRLRYQLLKAGQYAFKDADPEDSVGMLASAQLLLSV